MNKKLAIGISIIAGGALMASTALASASGSAGYDAYKAAFKNTRTAASATGTATITVTDNGKVIIQSNDAVKANLQNRTMSGTFEVVFNDQSKTITVYRQNDQTITKASDSDVYNVITGRPGKHIKAADVDKHDPALAKDVENIVDLLVGNYQNYITLDNNPDGTKEVSFALAESQVTPLVNAVASLAIREGLQEAAKKHSANPVEAAIQAQIPKLVEDIRVANVDVKASINEQDFITKQTADITITGKDAAGQRHEVVVSVDLNLTDINNTTPDTIDLTGKTVKNLQPKDMKEFHHRD